jgi:hypothetical protein
MVSYKLIRGLKIDNQIILLKDLEKYNIFRFNILPYDEIYHSMNYMDMLKKDGQQMILSN